MDFIHPTYLPFTPDQLGHHFTGDVDANVEYFRRSADRYRAFFEGGRSPIQPLSRSRRDRQIEKDEKFWTATALKTVFDSKDRVPFLREILAGAFGSRPPLSAFATWDECLEGDHLNLLFEAQLPSPSGYVAWIRKNLKNRHLIPYVFDAAEASGRRLEGATHVDAILLNPTNGFGVLFEAKVLSDISPSVSFDCLRNQVARNIDVMLDRQETLPPPLSLRNPDRSLFALLTPAMFKEQPHSRLYGWLLEDYRNTPSALGRDLPHRRREDWFPVSKRLGWVTFEGINRVAPGACPWMEG